MRVLVSSQRRNGISVRGGTPSCGRGVSPVHGEERTFGVQRGLSFEKDSNLSSKRDENFCALLRTRNNDYYFDTDKYSILNRSLRLIFFLG